MGHWGDRTGAPGGPTSALFDRVAPRLPVGWAWAESEWKVDMTGLECEGVDMEGWTYGMDFTWLLWPPQPGMGRAGLKSFVRRRRWVRRRVRIASLEGGQLPLAGREGEQSLVSPSTGLALRRGGLTLGGAGMRRAAGVTDHGSEVLQVNLSAKSAPDLSRGRYVDSSDEETEEEEEQQQEAAAARKVEKGGVEEGKEEKGSSNVGHGHGHHPLRHSLTSPVIQFGGEGGPVGKEGREAAAGAAASGEVSASTDRAAAAAAASGTADAAGENDKASVGGGRNEGEKARTVRYAAGVNQIGVRSAPTSGSGGIAWTVPAPAARAEAAAGIVSAAEEAAAAAEQREGSSPAAAATSSGTANARISNAAAGAGAAGEGISLTAAAGAATGCGVAPVGPDKAGDGVTSSRPAAVAEQQREGESTVVGIRAGAEGSVDSGAGPQGVEGGRAVKSSAADKPSDLVTAAAGVGASKQEGGSGAQRRAVADTPVIPAAAASSPAAAGSDGKASRGVGGVPESWSRENATELPSGAPGMAHASSAPVSSSLGAAQLPGSGPAAGGTAAGIAASTVAPTSSSMSSTQPSGAGQSIMGGHPKMDVYNSGDWVWATAGSRGHSTAGVEGQQAGSSSTRLSAGSNRAGAKGGQGSGPAPPVLGGVSVATEGDAAGLEGGSEAPQDTADGGGDGGGDPLGVVGSFGWTGVHPLADSSSRISVDAAAQVHAAAAVGSPASVASRRSASAPAAATAPAPAAPPAAARLAPAAASGEISPSSSVGSTAASAPASSSAGNTHRLRALQTPTWADSGSVSPNPSPLGPGHRNLQIDPNTHGFNDPAGRSPSGRVGDGHGSSRGVVTAAAVGADAAANEDAMAAAVSPREPAGRGVGSTGGSTGAPVRQTSLPRSSMNLGRRDSSAGGSSGALSPLSHGRQQQQQFQQQQRSSLSGGGSGTPNKRHLEEWPDW